MEDAYELRIPHGKGYRIYFGIHNDTLLLLLCGGDKQSKSQQALDIATAQQYWSDYKRRFSPND